MEIPRIDLNSTTLTRQLMYAKQSGKGAQERRRLAEVAFLGAEISLLKYIIERDLSSHLLKIIMR